MEGALNVPKILHPRLSRQSYCEGHLFVPVTLRQDSTLAIFTKIRCKLERPSEWRQAHPTLQQRPYPDRIDHQDIKEAKDERSSKDYRVIGPGIILRDTNLTYNNRPWLDPENVGYQRLI